MSLKQQIRDTLSRVVKYRQWIMDHGYGRNTMEMRTSVSRVKATLDYYRDKGPEAHVHMLRQIREDVLLIMPVDSSRRPQLREKVMKVLAVAESKEVCYG